MTNWAYCSRFKHWGMCMYTNTAYKCICISVKHNNTYILLKFIYLFHPLFGKIRKSLLIFQFLKSFPMISFGNFINFRCFLIGISKLFWSIGNSNKFLLEQKLENATEVLCIGKSIKIWVSPNVSLFVCSSLIQR